LLAIISKRQTVGRVTNSPCAMKCAEWGTPVQIGKLINVKVALSASARETVVFNNIILKRIWMRCVIFEGRIIIH
jgi:uncharacterized protein YbaA (DUF1428 family)